MEDKTNCNTDETDETDMNGSQRLGSKNIPIYIYNPLGKNLFIYARLKNEVGALSAVSAILKEMSINIGNGITSVFNNEGEWSFFAVSKQDTPKSEEILKRLKSSRYVLDAYVAEDTDGLLVFPSYPVRWNTGERTIVTRLDSFIKMLDSIRSKFGSVGEAIIYEQGIELGKLGFSKIVNEMGREFALSHLRELIKIYNAIGFGKVELVYQDLEKQEFRIKIEENFECSGHSTTSPYSRFVRGNIMGAFLVLIGKELEIKETKCIAMNQDFCEFEVSPQE